MVQLHDILERQNYRNNNKISGGQSGRWECRTQRFLGYSNEYMSKPIECTLSRMNHNVNFGLWLTIFQCRFINCNQCTTLVGDVDNKGSYACLGEGKYEKSL